MFLYAFISNASISFPHLFLRSLNEVHRSSAVGHALMHLIFIHRILLFLGLAIVAPLGATFLRQRATHLRVDPSGTRGASSGVVALPPSSTGADAVETSGVAVADAVETFGVAAADANVPPPTTSDDSDI